jgi:hypothetical protein
MSQATFTLSVRLTESIDDHGRIQYLIEACYRHLRGSEYITVTGPDVRWLDDPEIYAELVHESKALRLRQTR